MHTLLKGLERCRGGRQGGRELSPHPNGVGNEGYKSGSEKGEELERNKRRDKK